jgi:aspartate dehydrogenase
MLEKNHYGRELCMSVRSVESQLFPQARPELTVAVAGLGAIGRVVAEHLDHGIPGLRMVAVAARDRVRAEATMSRFRTPVHIEDIGNLAAVADVIIECVPAEAFSLLAEPAMRAGRTLVVISVGAFIAHPTIVDLATQFGGRIIVPTGALLGLDAVQAAAQGTVKSIRMITRKPPAGLLGAPYLVEHGIDVANLSAPLKVFEGTAREAVRGFPANVNVAAALGLAGIGPDRTLIEIWADPALDRNKHTIIVEGDSADIEMSISNIPSENPRTGKITALSIIAALRKMTSTVQIGT